MEKVSPELKKELEQHRSLAMMPKKIRVIVELQNKPSPQAVEEVKTKFNAKVIYKSKISRYISVDIDFDKIDELASRSDVVKVWHNPKYAPLDEGEDWTHQSLMKSAHHLNIDALKQAGFTGKNVVVAVIDTGMQNTHPMLQGKIIAEQSFVEGNPNTGDALNHGTLVASIIAGNHWYAPSDTDPTVLMEMEGMAPDAKLINARVFDDAGGGTAEAIMSAIEWACTYNPRPKIANMSLGSTAPYEPMRVLIESVMDMYGTIFVCAAGNAGSEGTINYPGGDPRTVCVGSIGINMPEPNAIAPFSSGGPSAYTDASGNPLIKPDIMATGGVDIISGTSPEELVCGAGNESNRCCNRGTSFATPHISGGLATMIEAGIPNPVNALYSTAGDLLDVGKDNASGFGVANFAKASNLTVVNPHSLTIASSIGGIVYVDNIIHVMPWSEQLSEEEHIVRVPKYVLANERIYEFMQWENSETALTRTINLTSDVALSPIYKQLSAYVVYPTENSRVMQGYPDTHIRDPIGTFAMTNNAERALVKFNLASLPAGLMITGGFLSMYCVDLTIPRTVAIHIIGDGWSEDSATWNNKPTVGAFLSSSLISSIKAQYEWDLGNYAKAEYDGDKILSVCLKDMDETAPSGYFYRVTFEGRSSKFAPYLVIFYQATEYQLSVNASISKVPVYVNGLLVGTTPCTIPVVEGNNVISVPEEVEA